MEKRVLVISRRWHNPKIEIGMSDDGIEIKTGVDDFVRALSDEAAEPLVAALISQLGPPTLWMTRKRLADEIVGALEGVAAQEIFAAAAQRVFAGLKAETKQVA
jgi:Asp/Glu/hydantoin racemase